MPYVHLVRHAQPDFAGDYDSLTVLGVQQSAWLGEHYAALGQSFDRLVSGSLERQRATLRPLAAQLPVQRELTVDPRWNEYDAAGLMATFRGADDAAVRAAGDKRGYFRALRSVLLDWSRDTCGVDGRESWRAFGERIEAALAAAVAGLEPQAEVLIVTSGGVIGRIVAGLLDTGAEAAVELNLQTRNTGITEIACGRKGSRLVAFNAAPHLQRPGRAHALTYS